MFPKSPVGRSTGSVLTGLIFWTRRGASTAYPIERLYRDARALWFEEGTAEIQKTVIPRELLNGHP